MQYLRKSKRVRATYPDAEYDEAHTPLLPSRWAPAIIAGALLVAFATLGLGAVLQKSAGHLSADVSRVSPARAPTAQSNEWHEYISTKDDFSVTFPGSPTKSEEERIAQGRAVSIRTYAVTADDIEYAVVATEIPKELDAQSSALAKLDGAITALAADAGGSITARSMTRVEGFPSADVTVTTADNGVLRARIVLTDSRFYMLLQGVRHPSDGTGSYSRFRESFDIAPR